MGTFTRVVDLRRHQEARYQNVRLTTKRALVILAYDLKGDFQDLTRGQISERQLRRIRHPYARSPRKLNIQSLNGYRGQREGKRTQVSARGRVPDLPINYQTGRLHHGITLTRRALGLTYDLYSTAPHARFVLAPGGTRTMRPRGLKGPKGALRKRYLARHAGLVAAHRKANRTP